MTDMQTRPPAAARSTSERLLGLVEAHRHITADLAPAGMIGRIVEASCRLVNTSAAGVVTLCAEGTVSGCVARGLPPGTFERIVAAASPAGGATGRGALERALHMRGAGFTFIPIQVRGERFGELYVRTAGEDFDADTSLALEALAAMAGTALENAVLYEEAARSKDWLHASGQIARAMLAAGDVDMLMEVVHRALHVAEADAVSLLLPQRSGLLEVAVSAGLGADAIRGALIDPQDSPLAHAVIRGESLLVADVLTVASEDFENTYEFGPVMTAPLVDAHGVRGAVMLSRTKTRQPFSARDLDLATTFADQVALAMEMDDARTDWEWVSVLEDRHRIAQDLHDNVMQRLFATGVGLQSLLAGGQLTPDIAKRLGRYIDDFDETIDEIRNRVFGLRDANGHQVKRRQSRFPRVARDETSDDAP